ncbi:MAG: 3'-5' exonuclease [Rhodothermales bacterium]|nr:3'-5' exonuclease [Rhodothermales bacterium]
MHLDRPLVFFDLETTGVDVENDHVIEVALVKVWPDRTKKSFESLVNPGRFIPPEVTELTGIGDEDVKSAPTFVEIANDLEELLGDADLAGYNAVKFDLPVLQKEFERLDREMPGPSDQVVLDAFEIMRKFEQRTLGWSLNYYLSRDLPDAHRAMVDVTATEDIMREQILRYELRGTPKEIVSKLRYPFLDSGRRLKVDGEHVIICFGRYRGLTLKELTESDPSYISWMMENMDREVVDILKLYVHFDQPETEAPPLFENGG